ncbi:Nucleoside-diphosphate-sugar pyrophosphorylase family protein [Halovivax ruber XH-70]|uniref:Bifunctional protein GlmU n=1 Tax=Halovivax ruber (strain DSM 18193 / JCM 13892 / XH-70) TaxID=797302 RepID=L0IBM4_HALRX|nr:sugar phosphate nucleotidyltransferase [Halovivax ruber]AGB15646.1 Nucleoside-diphosphate-sugar pyrophosphorylase family protein [Halovivax ruber XH-70]
MRDSSVPAVVLAAGEGRRLAPLTHRRPKPMVPVANRPLLEHVVSAIAEADVDRIVLVVGHRQERIRTHFGDGDAWNVAIEYVEQPTRLGTAHAVAQAEGAVDGPFLVLNGDRIVDADLIRQVRERLLAEGGPVVSVTPSDRPSDYGVVTLDGDRVASIEEKPHAAASSSLINAGVYGFPPAIFDAIRETPQEAGELGIPTTLARAVETGSISAVRYRGTWLDVSHLWDLLYVTAATIEGDDGTDSTGVHETAVLAADVVLGDNARIGPNATVGGATALGANATVESNAVVANAVVLPDAVIESGAVVRDAVVGENAHVGANATIAGGPASVVVENEVYDDVEFGGVIGDTARVGGGATVEPGTIVGDGVDIAGGASVRGRFETDAVVRRG